MVSTRDFQYKWVDKETYCITKTIKELMIRVAKITKNNIKMILPVNNQQHTKPKFEHSSVCLTVQ
jgi:hypothetical protein